MANFPLMENQTAEDLLTAFLQGGQFPNALLLWGPAGVGKRTAARWLAQGLVCTQGKGIPCGVCAACRKVAADGHQDVLFLDNEGETIKIEVVRTQIIPNAHIRPGEAERKVFIIVDFQNMRVEAQNALLKTLEEPPAGVHFILTATSVAAVLPTIASRCVSVHIRTMSDEGIAARLQEKFPAASQKDRDLAIALGGGSLGQSMALLGRKDLTPVCQLAISVAEALNAADGGNLLLALAPLGKGEKSRKMISSFFTFFTALLLHELGGQQRFLDSLSPESLVALLGVMRDLDGLIPANVNASTLLLELHHRMMQCVA